MADCQVTATGKYQGDITALCGSTWRREKRDAISDINSGLNTYFVLDPSGRRSNIHVVNGPYGPYLRSAPNATGVDNLDSLPDC